MRRTGRAAWHHAYNGIPAVRDKHAFSEAPEDQGAREFYGDAAMEGHDHLSRERLSGEIEVKIRVKTPTLPAHQTKEGLLVVPSRSGDDAGAQTWDDATIPVTSLKGMLSAAYETVTSSRFRVFGDHCRPVTSRTSTHESLNLYPVLLRAKSSGELTVRVMLGDNPKPQVTPTHDGWDEPPATVCAAVIPDSPHSSVVILDQDGEDLFEGGKNRNKWWGDVGKAEERICEFRSMLPHGTQVQFAGESERFFPRHRRIIVCRVTPRGERRTYRVARSKDDGYRETKTFIGIVVRLTPPGESDPLIDTKCNEFVFFNRRGGETDIPIGSVDAEGSSVFDSLAEIVHSYVRNIQELAQREHRAKRTVKDLEADSGRTSLSPSTRLVHDLVEEWRRKNPGAPLHEMEMKHGEVRNYLASQAREGMGGVGIPLFASIRRGEVVGLYPSQIGRRASDVSPDHLAHDAHVEPARSGAMMSPAERLWGFVAPERTDGADRPAARGRITIGAVEPVLPPPYQDGGASVPLRVAPAGRPWVLPTAASPKPSTGVPYLRAADGRPLDESTRRSETFSAGQALIRKVYPTHQFVMKRPVIPRPRGGGAGEGQPQVGSYLTAGAAFTTRIRYEDVSAQELAVLMWLLTPKRLVPKSEKKRNSKARGVHHLGFGRPLGMGAIEVEAVAMTRVEGRMLASGYRNLSGCMGLPSSGGRPQPLTGTPGDQVREAVLDNLPEGFEQNVAVRSFVRAAYGWDDSIEYDGRGSPQQDMVTYPGAQRGATDGELSPIITWFKRREENRVKVYSDIRDNVDKKKRTRIDSRFDLPPLVDPPGSTDAPLQR